MSYDFSQFQSKSQKTLDHVRQELNKLRTGRATAQLLDPVRVAAYGTTLSIQEVATVTVADPTLLIVKPYDRSQLETIAKAVQVAELNLNPIVGQDDIKIVVPALTQERREEMIKVLHARLEEGRVMLRSIRSDTKRDIEDQKGSEDIGEDDIKRDLADLELEFKKQIDELELLAQEKEKDLMTI